MRDGPLSLGKGGRQWHPIAAPPVYVFVITSFRIPKCGILGKYGADKAKELVELVGNLKQENKNKRIRK